LHEIINIHLSEKVNKYFNLSNSGHEKGSPITILFNKYFLFVILK